ncbi:hypothetical protein JW916_11250 [Candidatus Sumerlaeota bacterium]|nr:hypothetical protein [Candidatus Sumerlaeota bacterium]
MTTQLDWNGIRDGLWMNSRDFIRHALDHLRELREIELAGDNRKHHLKWAILSVHHAAECFCNAWLAGFHPEDIRSGENGNPRFPSLRRSVKKLENHATPHRDRNLSSNEIRLLPLLKTLPDIRNRVMHGTVPDDLDGSAAAISLLGLLRVFRTRIGEPSPEFQMDSPRVEVDVLSAIRYARIEEYIRLAEQMLREEHPEEVLGHCSLCDAESVVGGYCEICFEEIEQFECPQCGEEAHLPSLARDVSLGIETACPSCGTDLITGKSTAHPK